MCARREGICRSFLQEINASRSHFSCPSSAWLARHFQKPVLKPSIYFASTVCPTLAFCRLASPNPPFQAGALLKQLPLLHTWWAPNLVLQNLQNDFYAREREANPTRQHACSGCSWTSQLATLGATRTSSEVMASHCRQPG